jgi:hypothetical protein
MARQRSTAASLFAIVLLLICLPSLAPRQFSTFVVPGTHAFLDDYVYLQDVDLRNAKGRIATYDWRGPPQGWPNVVAFDDGRVEILVDENHARPLFEHQGIPYPKLKETAP